jgi:hypothetical protein
MPCFYRKYAFYADRQARAIENGFDCNLPLRHEFTSCADGSQSLQNRCEASAQQRRCCRVVLYSYFGLDVELSDDDMYTDVKRTSQRNMNGLPFGVGQCQYRLAEISFFQFAGQRFSHPGPGGVTGHQSDLETGYTDTPHAGGIIQPNSAFVRDKGNRRLKLGQIDHAYQSQYDSGYDQYRCQHLQESPVLEKFVFIIHNFESIYDNFPCSNESLHSQSDVWPVVISSPVAHYL